MLTLAAVLALLALPALADPAGDHRAALRAANAEFNAAYEACSDLPWHQHRARNKCRSTAKAQHTKAVEKADRMMTASRTK
jgi:hypothetical protein